MTAAVSVEELRMNLHDVRQLLAFNQWADRQFFDALRSLAVEPYRRDLQSSHGGIHGTLAHLVGVEKAWLFRWLQRPVTAAEEVGRLTSLPELRAYWEEVWREMSAFLDTLDERKLQDTLTTQSLSGEFTATYGQMIQHVVDHSSYHRGQIVAMLRQLGVTPPSTGMMRFYREGRVGTGG
jgi:uncharacterized damage-inducible protein DinB